MEGGIVIVGILIGILAYFIPAMMAGGKRNYTAIFWLNLLLGWTVLGWIGALIWALTQDDKPASVATPAPEINTEKSIALLKKLRDEGHLTQDEFMEQVARMK